MKPKRLLFTIPNFKTAGSQYVLLALFERLDKSRFDPYVLVEKFPKSFPEIIPKEKRLHISYSGNTRKDLQQLARLLKEYQFPLVHSWDYRSKPVEALACRQTGTTYLFTKKNNAWSKRWWLKSFLAHHIVYDNPAMAGRFFSSWPLRKKTTFIPHGVDTERFKPMEREQHNGFKICCVGNIGKNKNQLVLLKSLTRLPETVSVHLYGKEAPQYRKLLEEYVENNNLQQRVFFEGVVPNTQLPQVLNTCDLFVLPSLNEGFPVSVLEAMACETPVLASNSGGGTQHILGEGSSYIFDPLDGEGLAHAVQDIMKTPSATLREITQKNRQRVMEHFTQELEADAYAQLYQKLGC